MKRIFNYKVVIAFSYFILLLSHKPFAQDDFDFNESEENNGFGIPVSGRLSLESAGQLKNPARWISLGPSLNLIVDSNTYLGQVYFEGTGRYNLSYRIEKDSKETRKDHEFEPVLREFFWKNNFDNFTFSAGKMIDDFSVMDLLQVVDKLSVVNRTDYFFADPEEVKLGQNIIKLEYYMEKQMNAGFILVPYPSFDRISDGDHPYAFVRNRDLQDEDDRREIEGSAYISRAWSKGGFSFYAGRFNNRLAIIDAELAPNGDAVELLKTYESFWSIGHAFTAAFEPFLLKAETTYNFDKPLQSEVNDTPSGAVRENQLEFALGTDINLGDSGFFTVEFLTARPMQKNEKLTISRSTYFGALSWSNNYLNDKLRLSVIKIFPESIENMISRFQFEYYLTNLISVSGKYVRFSINQKKGDYGFMDDYDRVELNLNFDFNME